MLLSYREYPKNIYHITCLFQKSSYLNRVTLWIYVLKTTLFSLMKIGNDPKQFFLIKICKNVFFLHSLKFFGRFNCLFGYAEQIDFFSPNQTLKVGKNITSFFLMDYPVFNVNINFAMLEELQLVS